MSFEGHTNDQIAALGSGAFGVPLNNVNTVITGGDLYPPFEDDPRTSEQVYQDRVNMYREIVIAEQLRDPGIPTKDTLDRIRDTDSARWDRAGATASRLLAGMGYFPPVKTSENMTAEDYDLAAGPQQS